MAASSQQMASTSEENGEAAEQAWSYAEQGVAASAKATEAMESLRASTGDVTHAIRELASKSEQIGGIVETITGIAGQTNLLARLPERMDDGRSGRLKLQPSRPITSLRPRTVAAPTSNGLETE